MESEWGDEYAVAKVYYYRSYTEQELEAERKRVAENEARDRAQWERLAKKYGVVTNV